MYAHDLLSFSIVIVLNLLQKKKEYGTIAAVKYSFIDHVSQSRTISMFKEY